MSVILNNQAFSIINDKDQKQTIYITNDASWNEMTFTITNNSTADLTLKGGTPVNEPTSGAASSFVFDFSYILTEEVVSKMTVEDSKKEWNAKFFPGGDHISPSWGVAPLKDMPLPAGAVITFKLTGITCDSQNPGNFDVKYFNVGGAADRPAPYTYHISLLNPPSGKALPIDMVFADVVHLIGSQTSTSSIADDLKTESQSKSNVPIPIDITYNNSYPIKNGVTLYLKNTSNDDLEPQGTQLGSAAVYISFVFASDDPDAITSQANGDNISIDIDPEKSSWGSTKHEDGTAYWKFYPKSPEVMFANETVKFPIGNIITELLTTPNTLSTIYVQFNNIPGYDDMVVTFEGLKSTAEAKVNTFTVNPSIINYGEDVKLSWNTEVAWRVTLDYVDRNGGNHFLDSAKGEISLNMTNFKPNPAPSKEVTTFTLAVYDADTDPADQQYQNVTVHEPAATITSFKASPQLVDISASANKTLLSWEVENEKTVTLKGYGIQTGTNKEVTINGTTTFTLTVSSYGTEHPDVSQTITVYAYKTGKAIDVGPMGDGTAFQSLPLSVVNLVQKRIYVANAKAAATYQISETLKTGVTPNLSGNIMALSPDQTRLILTMVASGAPSTVNMYDTANSQLVKSVTLNSPPPYCMIISPDQTKLFLAQQHNLTAVSFFTISVTGNTMTQGPDIAVGKSPRAFIFDSSGANLYVANYDSSSVSVIDVATQKVTATITLQTGQPRDFALVGTNLYVACSAGNQVARIDTTTNKYLDQIEVGDRPFDLTLNQNKSLLFVCNFGENTVSVIATDTNKVTGKLEVGKAPSSAKITSDGSIMYVSNYCDKTLSVVDLLNGQQSVVGAIPLGTTNGNPIDVTTFADINGYTDVFIAKEYFKDRNNQCTSATAPTDANLNVSLLSIQQKVGGSSANVAKEEVEPDDIQKQKKTTVKTPIPMPKKGIKREQPTHWFLRFLKWLKELLN